MSEEAFIYEAVRTPRGKQRNGSLNEIKPVNLVDNAKDPFVRNLNSQNNALPSDVFW